MNSKQLWSGVRFVVLAWREYYLCEYSGSLGATSQGGKIPEMLSIKHVRLVILAQKGILIVARVRWKKSMIYVYVWKNTRNAFLKLDECGSCTKVNRYSLDALYARHGSRSCKNIACSRLSVVESEKNGRAREKMNSPPSFFSRSFSLVPNYRGPGTG